MANQRNIKNRIKSIKNTKKITSTMEMVASAKMKKMQLRLEMSKAYESKVNEIMTNLLNSEITELYDPLFSEFVNPNKIMIVQLTGNRGLCGSFNTNVIFNSLTLREKLTGEGKETFNYVIGKKGSNYLKFINEPIYKFIPNPEDKITFDFASRFCNELRDLFISGEMHEIYISYTKVITRSSQKPEIFKLLPITPPEIEEEEEYSQRLRSKYIFDPDPEKILSYILPLYLNVKVFNCFIESSFSEQFARRIAMKNATDASGEIIKELTVTYNRARQAKITNEIAEICGGAAALD